MSERGYSNNEISKEWLETVFDPQTRDKATGFPRLLVVDGHSSHYSYEFIEYAHSTNIVVLCLPPHTTHVLQSMSIFTLLSPG